jgi:hypothetical protein
MSNEKLFNVTVSTQSYDQYHSNGNVYKFISNCDRSSTLNISILSVVCELQEQNKLMSINIAELREQNNMLSSQISEMLNILKYQPGTGSEYLKAKEDYEKNKQI